MEKHNDRNRKDMARNEELKKQESAILFDVKKIQGLSDSDTKEAEVTKTCVFGAYVICMIVRGEGSYEMEGRKCHIRANEMRFFPPYRAKAFETGKECEGFIISFSEDFLLKMNMTLTGRIKKCLFLKNLHLRLRHRESVEKLRGLMTNIYETYRMHSHTELAGISSLAQMMHLLCEVMFTPEFEETGNLPSAQGEERQSALSCRKFIELVEEHYRQWHLVKAYLDEMGVSQKTLTSYMKKITGNTPRQLIEQRILIEAKRMLRDRGTQVGTIAKSLGYDDISNFSRTFKRITGLSPNEYRSLLD